tara:strand:- start:4296 stop:4493 length:198 start_codon:yes stop_codon:yes gene_type:complete
MRTKAERRALHTHPLRDARINKKSRRPNGSEPYNRVGEKTYRVDKINGQRYYTETKSEKQIVGGE